MRVADNFMEFLKTNLKTNGFKKNKRLIHDWIKQFNIKTPYRINTDHHYQNVDKGNKLTEIDSDDKSDEIHGKPNAIHRSFGNVKLADEFGDHKSARKTNSRVTFNEMKSMPNNISTSKRNKEDGIIHKSETKKPQKVYFKGNPFDHNPPSDISEEVSDMSINPNNKQPNNKQPNMIANDIRYVQFFNHLVENGKHILRKIGENIYSKLSLDKKSTLYSLINDALDSFASNTKNYLDYISKKEPKSEIDKEYVILDAIESCNMLFYSEEKTLLNKFIEKGFNNNLTQTEKDLFTEEIYKEYVNHKKQEIFYVCERLNICRTFPGLTDYFAEFIAELLKLSDDYLVQALEIISELIKNRTQFFKSFMKDEIVDMIGVKMGAMSSDLYKLKEFLSIVRSIITQRYKLVNTKDYMLRKRTKAVRILMDLIDKTFSIAAGEELTAMTFDTGVQALRSWRTGARNDISLPLKVLMEHIVEVTRHNWDTGMRDEVAILTEIIMTGKTDEVEIYHHLFSVGSEIGKTGLIEY